MTPETLPQTIGPYRITALLGRGGMGVVYRGVDESGQECAIKTIHGAKSWLLASVRREVQALAAVVHPGVVRILGEGIDEGLPWFALELVEGTALRDHARATALDPSIWKTPPVPGGRAAGGNLSGTLRIVRRLCPALAALHGEGIVHRDLKPENVLVREGGRPVLVDFGITSHFSARGAREILEIDGMPAIAGTPAYMSPEQILGERVDARADLYSLGCILYELLTGRPPFVGADPRDVLRAQRSEPPVPPSRLVSGIPPALDELLLRLLAKSPRERFGHAADVATALSREIGDGGESLDGRLPRSYLYRPRLHGRTAELRTIAALVERAREGKGSIALVGSPAGSGKTRLALEAGLAAAQTRITVYDGECDQTPLSGFERLLLRVGDRCREEPGAVSRLLGAAGPVLAPLSAPIAAIPEVASLPPPVDLPPEGARLRLFGALAALLDSLGREHPTLVALDDLHSADELTLGFLETMARTGRLEASPVVLLATFRREEADDRLRELFRASGVVAIEPPPLAERDLRELVGDMLAIETPPERLTRTIVVRAAGNPLFAAEFLRAAIAAGALFRDGAGRWRTEDDDRTDTALPDTLRELAARRFAKLPPRARQVAELAAILGGEGLDRLLRTAAKLPGASLPDLDVQLHELLAREILSEGAAGELRFASVDLGDAAVAALDPARARALHGFAARVVESLPEAERSTRAAAHAGHLEASGAGERARETWLLAARRAATNFALADAERCYRAALRLSTSPAQSAPARVELARDVLAVLARTHEAIAEHRRALDEAKGAGDNATAALALQGLSTAQRSLGALEEAQELAERALAACRVVGNARAEGTSFTILAAAHLARGNLRKARQFFQQALEIHQKLGNRKLEAITLSNLAVIDRIEGKLAEARRKQEDALRIHVETKNRRSEGITTGNLGQIFQDEGDLDSARIYFESAIELLAELGDRRFEAVSRIHLAGLEHVRGRLEEATAKYAEALAIVREVDDRTLEAEALRGYQTLERHVAPQVSDLASPPRGEALAAEVRRLGSTLLAAEYLIEWGHLALARGEDAGEFVDKAHALVTAAELAPESPLGRRVRALERAGENDGSLPTWRGELVTELPEGLRRRLAEG